MSKKWMITAVIFMMFAVVLAACGGDKKYEPQAINPETDRCAVCNMAVNDDAFATQIITKEGQVFKFDDIGCMNEWMQENGKNQIGAAYVRDYHSKSWITYEQAYYVYDASFKTPMAYGIVSFKDESAAKAFVEEQGTGKLMTAEELDGHTWERNREMMEMMKHEHMGHDHAHEADHGHSHNEQAHDEHAHDAADSHDVEHAHDEEHSDDGGHAHEEE